MPSSAPQNARLDTPEGVEHLATLKKAAESSDVARLLLHYITDAKFAEGLHGMVYENVQRIERA